MQYFVLDTNLYISYFIDRNQEQQQIATKFFIQLENREIKIFLPSLILAEIIYILKDLYEIPKEQIINSLLAILSEDNLITENKNILLASLDIFGEMNLDFADCYLLAFRENKNCELITFDKKLDNKLN